MFFIVVVAAVVVVVEFSGLFATWSKRAALSELPQEKSSSAFPPFQVSKWRIHIIYQGHVFFRKRVIPDLNGSIAMHGDGDGDAGQITPFSAPAKSQ